QLLGDVQRPFWRADHSTATVLHARQSGVRTITGVDGTQQGSVTFDIVFTSLKSAGKKDFGVAHLNLVIGVDSDFDPTTGDSAGIDESVTIGVQISASTASHP